MVLAFRYSTIRRWNLLDSRIVEPWTSLSDCSDVCISGQSAKKVHGVPLKVAVVLLKSVCVCDVRRSIPACPMLCIKRSSFVVIQGSQPLTSTADNRGTVDVHYQQLAS